MQDKSNLHLKLKFTTLVRLVKRLTVPALLNPVTRNRAKEVGEVTVQTDELAFILTSCQNTSSYLLSACVSLSERRPIVT